MDDNSPTMAEALDHVDEIAEDLLRRLAALAGADASEPVSRQQFRALAEIERTGTLTVGGLEQAIGLAASSTSEMATRLVKAGLLKKRRGPFGGRVDGRLVTMELTDLGRKVCRQYRERAFERCRAVISRVSPEERPVLVLALRQVSELVRKGTE